MTLDEETWCVLAPEQWPLSVWALSVQEVETRKRSDGIVECRLCYMRKGWQGWTEPCNGYLSGIATKHKKDSQRERRKRLRERGLL